jgi:hypothetical protein
MPTTYAKNASINDNHQLIKQVTSLNVAIVNYLRQNPSFFSIGSTALVGPGRFSVS